MGKRDDSGEKREERAIWKIEVRRLMSDVEGGEREKGMRQERGERW